MQNNHTKPFQKFLVIWTGQLISSLGSGLTAFALAVYVFELTGTATSVSLVTLCAFLPSILLAPLGGVFADRFDRRLMMILGDALSASGLIYMLVVLATGKIALWQICLGTSISSIFVALMEPAYKATVTDLLSQEQYARASGMVQLAGSARYLLSPVIAGVLLQVADIKLILILDILTFFITISASLWVSLHVEPSVRSSTRQAHLMADLKEGGRAITARPGILDLIILMSLVTFFVGVIQTLYAPMILTTADAGVLGTVMTISATGMLIGSLVIGAAGFRRGYINMLAFGLCTAGIFFALMGSGTDTWLITTAGFLFFLAIPFINTGAEVLIRKSIPDSKQGRAWGLIGVISQLGYILAYSSAGPLADHVFTPLLMPDGALAGTIGKLIGTGTSRGIGFMFILSGIFVVILSIFTFTSRTTRQLELELAQTAVVEGA